jgi:hypothetical protein
MLFLSLWFVIMKRDGPGPGSSKEIRNANEEPDWDWDFGRTCYGCYCYCYLKHARRQLLEMRYSVENTTLTLGYRAPEKGVGGTLIGIHGYASRILPVTRGEQIQLRLLNGTGLFVPRRNNAVCKEEEEVLKCKSENNHMGELMTCCHTNSWLSHCAPTWWD